jgi:hypothetical protein
MAPQRGGRKGERLKAGTVSARPGHSLGKRERPHRGDRKNGAGTLVKEVWKAWVEVYPTPSG